MERDFNRKIVLEDGAEFYGRGFGFSSERVCELVFNTCMAGYQEIIYDPANASQMVVMTYPIIGNLGITYDDQDAKAPLLGALAVRQLNDSENSFAATLEQVMRENSIPGICELDTRELTRHVRGKGRVFAIITDADTNVDEAVGKIKASGKTVSSVSAVSADTKRYYRTSTRKFSVVVIDCGVKLSYIRLLNKYGCNVTVMPWNTTAAEISAMKPDGVFVSSGPGNADDVAATVSTVNALRSEFPIFGMGLGCEIIAAACGAETYVLPTGHRGSNHPVRNLVTGHIETVNQNHGYSIDIKSLENTGLELTHVNVIDGSAEGIMNESERLYGVLYYPENVLESAENDCMIEKFVAAMKSARG